MVRTAGMVAAAHGVPLVLYAEATEDDASDATLVSTRDGYEDIPPEANKSVVDGVDRFLEGVADDELAGLDVEYETVCSIVPSANHAGSVLRTAREYGCDRLFVVGEKRTPTGKALFGDFAQSLLLNFEGHVTVDLT